MLVKHTDLSASRFEHSREDLRVGGKKMLEAMYAIGEAVSNKFKGESEQVLYWLLGKAIEGIPRLPWRESG